MKTRLKINYFLYLIAFFALIKVTYLTTEYRIINIFYQYVPMGILLFLFVLYFIKKIKISKITMLIVLFEICYLISTYVNNGNIIGIIFVIIQELSFCLTIEYGIMKDKKTCLLALSDTLFILVTINAITMMIYPNGIVEEANWILGFKNRLIMYILPAILVRYIYDQVNKNKVSIWFYITLFIGIVSIAISKSSTSLVGIVIIILYIIGQDFIRKNKIFNINTYLLIVILLFLGIIIFRLQEYLADVIVNILGKDLTFTNRTNVWDYAMEFIAKKPFWGYGYRTATEKAAMYGVSSYTHAHNQILELLFDGGFIYFTFFVIIIGMVRKKLSYNRKEKISSMTSIFIFVYFIMMLTEFYNMVNVLYLLVIAYYVDILNEDKKGRNLDNEKNRNDNISCITQ